MKFDSALRRATLCAGILGVMATGGRLFAQAAPDATRPVAAGGNWWDAPAAPAAPPAPMPLGNDRRIPERDDLGRSPLHRENTVMDYPGPQMTDWVIANALAARARAVQVRAESELSDIIRRVQRRFERSEMYAKAVAEDKQAYAEYTAARQKAINLVAGDPKYHALSMLRDELAEKIAARRFAKDANRDEIAVMATLKMQYATDAHAMEAMAMNADDNVKIAREKMEQASRRLLDLKARFDDTIHDNPEVLAARRNLEDSRIAVVETSSLARGANIASDYAINYAYYLHRNDTGSPYGPYGPNGAVAGSSYSSPYWH
ncbi:MAG TPA: hypothetical protein VG326_02320 [Tepidisphaeraceae bacterium]|jgi:hypothetical protein|nr:hypothetical protein [Tepidisphaeraceae bacterium]